MQDSGTTAGLRGIDSVDGTVAWASGTGGTVLRTTDGGSALAALRHARRRQRRRHYGFSRRAGLGRADGDCDGLGPGTDRRLYKTTDGCKTWKLVFTNPDKDGFWDTVSFNRSAVRLASGRSCQRDLRALSQ